MIIAIIIGTLVAVAVAYGLFWAGRWYERRRLSALIDWGCQIAADVDASLSVLEATEQLGAEPEQPEQRVH